MEKTGEGVRPKRPSAETNPHVDVVKLLRETEEKASDESFRNQFPLLPGGSPEKNSIKNAGRAMGEMLELLRGVGVIDEMIRLEIGISFGPFSVSARPEDNQDDIDFWKKQGTAAPPVITFEFGPEKFSQKGTDREPLYWFEIEKMLENPKTSNKVRRIVGALSFLSPRDIAKAFREQIEEARHRKKHPTKKVSWVNVPIRDLIRGHR